MVFSAQTPLIIGHRGAPGYRPEHSPSAYRIAFAQGVDAVEPDIVATRDGVLVVRHENEISGTTDVAERPEFADRRRTASVDGHEQDGWFTEDFTWQELSTLRTRERLPELRPASAAHDGEEPMLRLSELFRLVDEAAADAGRPIGIVAEIKHATHFAAIGLPLDRLFAEEAARAGWAAGRPLWIESFEERVLGQLRARGVEARYVYLLEHAGTPFDRLSAQGAAAAGYADDRGDAGLARLVGTADGISVDKSVLLRNGTVDGGRDLVRRAHAAGLDVFTWTARPENAFLEERFVAGDGSAAARGDWRGEFSELWDAGVDGVFVDFPDEAVAFRAGRARDGAARVRPDAGHYAAGR